MEGQSISKGSEEKGRGKRREEGAEDVRRGPWGGEQSAPGWMGVGWRWGAPQTRGGPEATA